MNTKTIRPKFLLAACIALALAGFVHAEDVEKKFRIGIAAGTFDTQDEIESESANFLQLINENTGRIERAFVDPRNDAAAISSLQIETARRFTLSGQYAFTKLLLLEGAVGYQSGDVGNVEMQAQFDGEGRERNQVANFHIFNVRAGTLTQVPIQLTAMARFRPKAILNPFIGAGVGYTFVGFEPSSQFNQLSLNLDRSTGGFARAGQAGDEFGSPSSDVVNLSGADVSAPDSFEWHVAGGAEFGFKKRWSAFVDARYTWASNEFRIGFNGSDSVGIGVPNGTHDLNSIYGTTIYGTYHVEPGLVDGGCEVPISAVVPGAQLNCDPGFCAANPTQCTFIRSGSTNVSTDPQQPSVPVTLLQSDGLPDPGLYYLRGGKIRYGGLSLQVGVRFTF